MIRLHTTFLLALLPLALAACSPAPPQERETPSPPTQAEPAPQAQPSTPEAEPAPEARNRVSGRVRVVDLEGEPLPGMLPIVTRQPNAFDEPVAMGPATGLDGAGQVTFLPDQTLFLRAWDPELNWFPNNFLEIQPNVSEVPGVMTIMMVPAAAVEAQFFGADGAPLRNLEVDLMLSHAAWGPWWPTRSQTDGEGTAFFSHIPAGEFDMQFTAATGATRTLRQVALRPEGTGLLGPVRLD